MSCDSAVPCNLYISSVTGLQVRDEFGKSVFLPPLCACMAGTNWDLTKIETRKDCKTLCCQGQRVTVNT